METEEREAAKGGSSDGCPHTTDPWMRTSMSRSHGWDHKNEAEVLTGWWMALSVSCGMRYAAKPAANDQQRVAPGAMCVDGHMWMSNPATRPNPAIAEQERQKRHGNGQQGETLF